jgi:predicted naringenin-chalcone synthase
MDGIQMVISDCLPRIIESKLKAVIEKLTPMRFQEVEFIWTHPKLTIGRFP